MKIINNIIMRLIILFLLSSSVSSLQAKQYDLKEQETLATCKRLKADMDTFMNAPNPTLSILKALNYTLIKFIEECKSLSNYNPEIEEAQYNLSKSISKIELKEKKEKEKYNKREIHTTFVPNVAFTVKGKNMCLWGGEYHKPRNGNIYLYKIDSKGIASDAEWYDLNSLERNYSAEAARRIELKLKHDQQMQKVNNVLGGMMSNFRERCLNNELPFDKCYGYTSNGRLYRKF